MGVNRWVDTTVENATDAEGIYTEPDAAPVLKSAIALPWLPALVRGASVALSAVTVAAIGTALLATMAVREVPQFVVNRLWV